MAVPIAAVVAMWPTREALGAPGQGLRLGGIEPQGPASRAVTALHHNPAMLAAIPGTAVQASFALGVEHQRIRRNAVDQATGDPLSSLDTAQSQAHLAAGYFVGASLYFDPIAVGVGIYDLGSRYRFGGTGPLRYHLAPDPDPRCLGVGLERCPPNGGSVRYQHDLTVALAWNGGRVKLGAALHFPMIRERFAFDNDIGLSDPETAAAEGCEDKEDPDCAERVGFKGWTQWIPRGGAPSGFDFVLTVGAALSLANDTITLGARYRTPALRRGGEVQLAGVGLVCRPDAPAGLEAEQNDSVGGCDVAQPVDATLSQRLPQQLALGGSFLLGPSRRWRLDLDLYWMDLCPGGVRVGQCATSGAQTVRLIGLDRRSFVLPQFSRFRGATDLYGLDAFTRYRIKSNVDLITAGHLASPAIRRGATTATDDEGWRVGTSVGARVRLRGVNLVLLPGYGLDVLLPRRVDPGQALFSPSSATAFEGGSGDINATGAAGVLEGRGRPTNAARYLSLLHTLSLTVMWGERDAID
ncbi:MAG: hypothetical protein K0V04_44115 [Deltaproteobacteria bacterium]|nr:hypothetical protein [Deltaproteobacteria bacterium]